MSVTVRLSYLGVAQGYAEDYEIEVLVDGKLAGMLAFTHTYLDDGERRLDDPEDDDIGLLDVRARLAPAASCYPATELRLMADTLAFLNGEIERGDHEVIENLFGSKENISIDWLNPPTWLLKAVRRTAIERPTLKEVA